MDLEKIREQLMEELANDANQWSYVFDNVSPGCYGYEDFDVVIDSKNFYVDVPARTFTFKNVKFYAELVLGSSKSDDSFTQKYEKIANGSGDFTFVDKNKVRIDNIYIDIDLDIYGN